MSKSASKRFFRRFAFEMPIEFERHGHGIKDRFAGVLSEITYSGARLVTKSTLTEGEELQVYMNALRRRQWINNRARIVWRQPTSTDGIWQYGIHFVHTSPVFSKTLHFLIKRSEKPHRSISTMLVSLVMLAVGLPTLLIAGNLLSSAPFKTSFSLFIVFLCIERIWETFGTTKESNVLKTRDDWSMAAVTFYYIVMVLGSTAEFFWAARPLRIEVTGFGLSLLAVSFILRWWGMRSLGKQWAIHAVGRSKLDIDESSILRKGPYALVRHPIYLAAVLEVLAVPAVGNCFFTLGFVLLVNCPLMFLRSYLEEQTLFDRYSAEFVDYYDDTGRFLPKVRSRSGDTRRRESLFVDFPDRRKNR